MTSPNVLLIMTDEERYPPPYEDAAVAEFRRTHLPALERVRNRGVELHRHYAGSTACVPSRATLFTGQYPSLHGVSQTDGTSKAASDPAMGWLDLDEVPTLGDWFRAGGYQTHYRGKWHVSHSSLTIAGGHEGLMASDDDGRIIPAAVEAYRKADRLDPFGFSGWLGREPHGAAKSDCGTVRDGVLAEQVVDLFGDLAKASSDGPWLAVASFVNPHDISFAGRPACQEQYLRVLPQMIAEVPADVAYRRLYYYLHAVVDQAIGRILDALDESGMADDTIVVFTSDHGDLLGAHGGLQQKWCNAFDEATHVPLLIAGPGVSPRAGGITEPTSHVDLIPTLMGLAGIDVEKAAAGVATHHAEARPLPGRDLSGPVTGKTEPGAVGTPIYFMTEDDITRGLNQANVLTGVPFEPVAQPTSIESIIATLPTGAGGTPELWKLNHYYERLDDWNEAHGIPKNPFAASAAEPVFELHNLTVDPEERHNAVDDAPNELSRLESILDAQRDEKRLVPSLRNP